MARPADQALDAAITAATLDLIAESGLASLSIAAVATRANTARTSVYRRFPDKTRLVLAAVRSAFPETEGFEDAGSLRDDLLGRMRALARRLDGVAAGLLGAIRDDSELAGLVRSAVVETDRRILGEIVGRAVARGELAASPGEQVLAVPAAMLFWRIALSGQPLDDGYLAGLVDEVVLPLFTSGACRRG